MKIKKILNNNAVVVSDQGEEKIILGLAIAFQKRKNDLIDRTKIEKVFVTTGWSEHEKFEEILSTLPEEHIQVAEEIISYTEQELGVTLGEHIHIALTDHLSFALERLAKGMVIKNTLLKEIKILYTKEFQIGCWAKALIQDKLGVEIPEDEVGYIAMHIHTAKMNVGDMTKTMDLTTMIHDMIEVIEDCLHIKIPEETVAFERLVTHLRFSIQRSEAGESANLLKPEISQVIKETYKEFYWCAQKAGQFAKEEYDFEMSDMELVYIAIQIQKIYHKLKIST
ncbi:PRD domain-containing protein [Brevibacillus migulae]|uniref:PRD domain-containing protein n=1 Tax=Brevibacillus migulae TaxID=1644114 RepID=UPI00106E22C5|nr:PRD domain-containing protein [Brevibacillus migulae]